jgi:hypothetical protein
MRGTLPAVACSPAFVPLTNDDRRRHGHLRIRPNRPIPSRTERRLEIDLDSRNSVAHWIGDSPHQLSLVAYLFATSDGVRAFTLGQARASRPRHLHFGQLTIVSLVGEAGGYATGLFHLGGKSAGRDLASRHGPAADAALAKSLAIAGNLVLAFTLCLARRSTCESFGSRCPGRAVHRVARGR